MLAADALRAVVIGLLAVLSATGALTLWELAVLCAVYGVGTAFFNPAFDAVVPDILPADQLAAANSLDQFVRPLALRLAGPAVGGLADRGARPRPGLRGRRGELLRLGRRADRDREDAAPAPGAEPVGRRGRAPGLRVHPPARVALGHAALGRGRLPGLPRPDRGAPAVHGEERRPRLGRVARARVRSGRPRRDRLRARRWASAGSRAAGSRSSTSPGRSRRSPSPATASRPRPGS